MEQQNEIVLYQPDELTKLEVRVENETVWLSQQQMAELFGVNRQAITKHLKNIYDSHELQQEATCSILELVQSEGTRMVKREVGFYNLDAIISVGFRVNTIRGIQFRQWANRILKDYMLRGYAVNQRIERLEQKVMEHDKKIDFFVRTSLPPKEGVFYEGQIFDAYAFASDLVKSATKSLILIDNYIDESVFTLLDKRAQGVCATIYTQAISKTTQLDIDKHNAQYRPIEVMQSKSIHDRFLIIDEDVYHIGASIKDLGKKLFAFSKMEMKKEVILRANCK
ncbi:MAG: virulence RhuM family protein [Bacteroidaceae bacterium]|nr:virulence RhuM family protein [Bacteroidaceae bacterium]